MAKIVSDNLVIKIARKGEEKIHDLGRLFNENPNRVISRGRVSKYCPHVAFLLSG
jgi:hypothetical protein